MLNLMKEISWQQTKKQSEAWGYLLDELTVQLIFGGGAGGGKSFLGCAWLIAMAGQYPESRWLMGRAKLKNLKETTLVTFFDICRIWGLKEGVDYKYNSQDSTIIFANGSMILLKDLFLYPSDPNFDSLGSLEITGGFIDEVNQIVSKAWDIVFSRIRYKLDVFGLKPKLLGTCNPSKNWVYQDFYKPWSESKLPDNKKFVQALAKNNKFISKYYIENLKNIKDKIIRSRLLEGNWEYDDDPSCLFEYDSLVDLFTNKALVATEKFIIVDAARKGRDRMIVGYWEGLQLKEIHDLPYDIKKDTEKSAEWIANFAEKKQVKRSNVLVDEDGVGGGIVDKLKCKGFVNNSSPIQPYAAKLDPNKKVNFANLRTQCYFKLADLTDRGEIGIDEPNDSNFKDLIIEELEQIKQKDIDRDGKIALIGKEQIKENIGRSPDFADMIMMRCWFEVNDKPKPSILIV